MSTTIILSSLTDTSRQFRFTRPDTPRMRASSEPGQPWRWVWLLEDWWRAYTLPLGGSPETGGVVLWLVSGGQFTARDREGLKQEGWIPVDGSSVRNGPIRCDSIVIDKGSPSTLVTRQPVWVPGVLVPTQRTWACFENSLNVRVRCADFTTAGESMSAVLVVAHDEDVVTRSRVFAAGRGTVSTEHQQRVRQCDALAVTVSYFLGAPMVIGVDIHHPELLQPDDLRGSLPPDVNEELVEALRVLGVHRIAAGEDVWEDEGAD